MLLDAVQSQAAMEGSNPTTLWIFIGVVLLTVAYMIPFRAWQRARRNDLAISLGTLVGLKMRRFNARVIVDGLIKAKKIQLDMDILDLMAHYKADGSINRVMDALTIAHEANYDLTYDEACEIDLSNRNVVEEIKDIIRTQQNAYEDETR